MKWKIVIAIIVIFGGIVWLGFFWWKNLRGVGPATLPAPEDISEVINTPDFPLKLLPGFSISVFAKGLGAPRVMSYDPAGNLVVSIPSEGRVVALPDRNADGAADEVITVIDGLNRPHGLATRCTEKCEFYVAETDKVTVYNYEYDEAKKIHVPVNGRKIIDLPGDGGHFTRTVIFMPAPSDHKLLTSVGSSCNVCEESDPLRARILVSNADGSDLKEFAKGLRNAVFMTIHPVTGKIWATEMGRDFLGDDLPPDEINILKENGWYGWPWFYGKNVFDKQFAGNRMPSFAQEAISSHIDIPAHSAPLGLAFFPEEGWPEEYWHNLLVAYHGSWNRSEPTGYKIVRYKLDEQGNYLGEE
ncbi:MAG: PQQ-dependent sugar dehydrogenase, partial [Patescibacteria group bacterium]